MLFVAALIACASPPWPVAERGRSEARTLAVNADGSAEFVDLGSAIAAASDGDTIEAAPGNYYGSLDFDGKSVAVVGTGGAAATWLFASPGHAAVQVREGEGMGTRLEGFTVTGGGSDDSAAVDVSFAHLTLRNVRLTGNRGSAVLYARSGHVLLDRVVVEADNAARDGAVVEAKRGLVAVVDSALSCGRAAHGYYSDHGAAFLDGATFDCPGAVAATIFHGNGRVQRSVFDGGFHVENENNRDEATVVEGSLFLGGVAASTGKLELVNVVVAGHGLRASNSAVAVRNSILTRADCAIEGADGTEVEVRYSAFWANGNNACGVEDPLAETGNVEAPPQFVDAGAGDYHLFPGSAAVDAGDDDDEFLDTDGTRADMGAYGGPFTLDGGW